MEINLPFSSCPLHSLTDLTRDLVTSDSFFFKISELKGPDSVGVDKRQEDTTTKSAGYHVSLLYNFESLFTAPHLMVVKPSVRLGWRPRPDQGTRWYSPITEVDRSHSLRHWHCWKYMQYMQYMQSFLILYKALKSVMVGFDSNPLSYKGKTEASAQLSEI